MSASQCKAGERSFTGRSSLDRHCILHVIIIFIILIILIIVIVILIILVIIMDRSSSDRRRRLLGCTCPPLIQGECQAFKLN